MKFNLSIASLCLSFLAATKAADISGFAEQCGIDHVVVAENCVNNLDGNYYYSRQEGTCQLDYICMIPCETNELPVPSSKSLSFFTKGRAYCDIRSNIDVCQSDKKYYDYKQCLLITMRMDELEEISKDLVEELKSKVEPEVYDLPTITTASLPTVEIDNSNSPLKGKFKATQECGALNEPCGGSLYANAPNCCQEGLRCQKRNSYYSVCIAK